MITIKLPETHSNLKIAANQIIQSQYEFSIGTPALCADLISKLLIKEPSARFPADGVKVHP
jgi:hypothetical protein